MVQIIAHRGASRAKSENTVPAFRAARELGADAVELDVRLTADGSLVVHHDPYLPTGRPITDTPRSMLPLEIPSLDEALDACAGMWVNIEIKNDPNEPDFDPTDHIADVVVRGLVARGEPERWLISSFRVQTVNRCRLVEPAIATAWLCVEPPAGTPELMANRGHRAVHPSHSNIDEAFIASCHALGVMVNVWTCDDPAAMSRLASWGVDGIVTNVPDVAVATLRPGS